MTSIKQQNTETSQQLHTRMLHLDNTVTQRHKITKQLTNVCGPFPKLFFANQQINNLKKVIKRKGKKETTSVSGSSLPHIQLITTILNKNKRTLRKEPDS